MANSNYILTGPPRSGTTLSCYLLNKLPNVVALHEPMNIRMFPEPQTGLQNTATFFGQMRDSLLTTGIAISKVKDGMIPANPFENKAEKGSRKSIVKKGEVKFDKTLSPDFKLVMKHNAHFTFLLPQIAQHYPFYVILRHPIATIASWNSITAPVAQGNLRVLEFLEPELFHQLNEIPDLLDRQIKLLEEHYNRYQQLPRDCIIRYEDLIASGGQALQCIDAGAKNLNEALQNKNTNPAYKFDLLLMIKEKLLSSSTFYEPFYARADITAF